MKARALVLAAGLLACLGLGGCKRSAEPIATRAPDACTSAASCAAGEYCAFEPGLCGRGPKPGVCRSKPPSCPPEHSPVCGCDGKAHDGVCAASAAGVDLDVTGRCEAVIPDFIRCGAHFCDAKASYCEIYLSDVFELPSRHRCRELPAACRPGKGPKPQCDCFHGGTPCLSFCGPMPTGGIEGFHLTCQGVKER